MHKIGVIGDRYSVLGFKGLGVSVYPAAEAREAESALYKMAEEGYAVIYITEQFARSIRTAIEKYDVCKYPAVIPIPGSQGSLGLGREGIKRAVEKAVGADILFRDG